MQEIGSLLHDKSWLMRLGAVRATESFPTPIKWQLLQPQLDEPVAAVRYVLAEQLAGVSLQDLPARDQARLQVLFAEYLQRLAFTIDIPESLASRARFAIARNEPAAAEQDLLAALDRKRDVEGKSWSVRVDPVGCRIIKKK